MHTSQSSNLGLHTFNNVVGIIWPSPPGWHRYNWSVKIELIGGPCPPGSDSPACNPVQCSIPSHSVVWCPNSGLFQTVNYILPNSKPSHHQNSFDVEIVSNEKKIDVHSVFEVSRKLEKGGKLCSFFGHKSSLLNKVLPLLLPRPPPRLASARRRKRC